MTDDRRYSIIPAGAVADQRLEGRDLQVLCFLGTHTDKRGWCFLRQGEIARQLGTSRSTVQRSLARLIDAGYVTTRDFTGPRPHACHAYRVIMDADDPKLEPPADAEPDDDDDQRCPPVHTSAGGASPVGKGAQTGTGTSAPEVPTHAWAHKDQDSGGSGGDARARGSISTEAWSLAEEIGAIAGYPKPIDWPPGWCGAPERVDQWLRQGWRRETALAVARAMMAGKRDGPPFTIQYFEKAIAREMKRLSAPLPTETTTPNTPEARHASQGPNDWRRRRDAGHEARQQLRDWIDNAKADQRSGTG